MKIILYVEGDTEFQVLPQLLKKWLDPKLKSPIGIKVIDLKSGSKLLREIPIRARSHLKEKDVLCVMSLLDLYSLEIFPTNKKSVSQRSDELKQMIETSVSCVHFRHFTIVHELEALLLCDTMIFPREIQKTTAQKSKNPKSVNFDELPSKLLNRLYREKLKRDYKKTVHGPELFRKLDPKLVYEKCPYFRAMMDEMLQMAQAARLQRSSVVCSF